MENNCGAENLYKNTAVYYAEFRPLYSKEFLKKVLKETGAGKESKVLDLGSATGIVALNIAPLVKEVLAVDLEKEFLAFGAVLAKERGLENIRWIKNRAENMLNIHQNVDLTIISSAFHWMERKKVLDDLYEMTNPGGAIAIITHEGEQEWYNDEVKALVKKYAGDCTLGFWDRIKEEGSHEEILQNSNFVKVKTFKMDWERQVDADKIVGYLYSTERSSLNRLGENKEQFEKELRALLAKMPAEAFVEKGTQEALIAKKP